MVIRPYRHTDYSHCIAAFDSNCPDFFAYHEKEEFEKLLHDLSLTTQTGDNSDDVYYYVVEKDNRAVACAGFYLPVDNEDAMLVWGMVARDYHKQGIGEKLLTYRLEKIQEFRPGARVLLDTTQLSYPFFERSGFTVSKITPDFYAPGLDRYDMVLLPETNIFAKQHRPFLS
jgi:N-acetylglutamate synthase-like GNAT family acetyltransferase